MERARAVAAGYSRPVPRLKKRYGQHHLRHPHLCEPLASFLEPFTGPVIEVGPGGGALTGLLVERGARVWAWEADLEWALPLPGRVPRVAGVVVGDALAVEWSRLPAGSVVTGNLPYNISTALIDRVLAHPARIPRAAFLVQWEVALRITAQPGEADYGAFSVLTQARARPSILGRVAPGSFRPAPKVAGGLVGLLLEPSIGPAAEWRGFARLVRQAFSSRRKTLRNSLAGAYGARASERLLEAAGIAPGRRAQELKVSEFMGIYEHSEQAEPGPEVVA